MTATMTVTTVPMWPRDLRSDGTSSRGACYRHCRADSADGPSPTSDGTGAAWRADGHASPREPQITAGGKPHKMSHRERRARGQA